MRLSANQADCNSRALLLWWSHCLLFNLNIHLVLDLEGDFRCCEGIFCCQHGSGHGLNSLWCCTQSSSVSQTWPTGRRLSMKEEWRKWQKRTWVGRCVMASCDAWRLKKGQKFHKAIWIRNCMNHSDRSLHHNILGLSWEKKVEIDEKKEQKNI